MKNFFVERLAFISDFFEKLCKSKESLFEKIVSVFLFVPSIFMPGVLLKNLIGGENKNIRSGFVNLYVIVKVIFAFLALKNHWYLDSHANLTNVFYLLIYLTFETIIYNLVQIFCFNYFDAIDSFKRSILFAFLNYLEISFNFASFYAAIGAVRDSNHLNVPGNFNWVDYLYFSMGSGGIISYGNYSVYSTAGKQLVILHCIVFLMFVSLFITYNVTLLINKKA